MSDISKKQRNEIYEEAYEILSQTVFEQQMSKKYDTISVCDILDEVAVDIAGYDATAETLPEWWEQEPRESNKPRNHFWRGELLDFWWTESPQGHQARLRALKRCIELTQ